MENKDLPLNEIIKTLTYSAVFKYPLSFNQLGTYLGTKTSYGNLVKALRILEKTKKISQRNGKYYLYHKHTIRWRKAADKTKSQFEQAKKLLEPLKKIPWIKLLALTGPIAASSPQKNGDIDIFIIAQNKRLWITRLFVVMYLKATGTYRTDKNPKNKICPNLFISETNMTWPKENQNLFIASEIVRMQPLLNRDNTYLKFLTTNPWIKNYFPNFIFERVNKERRLNPGILDILEKFAYKIQKAYMKKKITTEKTALGIIHFNKNDKTKKIMNTYEKILEDQKVL